jgi:2-oxoglutarate ferredoxin oxidoreductase subunit alpha
MGERAIMKGNEALAEAAVRSGCRFFSGYPITPQTEILEYLSWRMKEVGGDIIQTEDEITGLHMVLGAGAAGARCLSTSSGPGFALFQEGISYLCGTEIPAVLVDVQRVGNACGNISLSQGDYEMVTKGGGNGDTKCVTLTPASVQETVDMTVLAFEIAEKYRQPVILLTDAAIGQMMEGIELPAAKEHDINTYDWTIKGREPGGHGKKLSNVGYTYPGGFGGYAAVQKAMYDKMDEEEQRWDNIDVADADVVCVAYGISSRVCKEAIKKAKAEGIKLGLIRPKTVVPFPEKAFAEVKADCKGLLVVEMSVKGQMVADVKLASKCDIPVYGYFTVEEVPESDQVIGLVKGIIDGKGQEVEKWQRQNSGPPSR